MGRPKDQSRTERMDRMAARAARVPLPLRPAPDIGEPVFRWGDPPAPIRGRSPRRRIDWQHRLDVLATKPGVWARVAIERAPGEAEKLAVYLRRRYRVESVSRGAEVYARWVEGQSSYGGKRREAGERRKAEKAQTRQAREAWDTQ